MVEAIKRVSGTSASSPTSMDFSTSIEADPDSAWVAARQSHMAADMLDRKEADGSADETVDTGQHAASNRPQEHGVANSPSVDVLDDDNAGNVLLSGESERIGTRNFDEATPFGERVAIV